MLLIVSVRAQLFLALDFNAERGPFWKSFRTKISRNSKKELVVTASLQLLMLHTRYMGNCYRFKMCLFVVIVKVCGPVSHGGALGDSIK